MLYYTGVRWWSRGRVLRCFYELLPEIYLFLYSQNKAVPELIDPEWKWQFAFLTDITEVLNSFNLQLQGQGKLICDMYSHIKAFELKLKLLLRQVKNHSFIHLSATQNLSADNPVVAFQVEKCVEAFNRCDGVVVRASASQSVDLGLIPLVESYQKTLKNGIYSFPAWRSTFMEGCGEQAGKFACCVLGQGT